jgi:photosystem II stability/assembly factor-like uncharacterized protein
MRLSLLISLYVSILVVGTAPSAEAGRTGAGQAPWCRLEELVGRVDADRLAEYVRELSGADTVYINGDPEVIVTRYAHSEGKLKALQYLLDEVAALGYAPRTQRFLLTVQRPDIYCIATSHSFDTVWVGSTQGDIFRSTSASGWGEYEICGRIDGRVFDLEVDTRGRIWAACGEHDSGFGALYVSSDGGESWKLIHSGSLTYTLYSVTFEDETFGIAAGANGTVIRTGDGGGTWWSVSPGFNSYYSTAASNPIHFWMSGNGGLVWETTNAGGTWTSRHLTNSWLYGIDFSGSNHGITVGNGVAFYTDDGGATWNSTDVSPGAPVQPDLNCVEMFDTQRAAAGGGEGIYLSENGGVDWQQIDVECASGMSIKRLTFADRNTIWAAGGHQVIRILLGGPAGPTCYVHEFSDTIWGYNVIFSRNGTEEPDRKIMLCAHYDSQSPTPYECAPGADDNASGVAGVLESAGALAGSTLERTIEFVLFDGEEIGLLGSRYFASYLDTNDTYDAVINLDMIAHDISGNNNCEIAGRHEMIDSVLASFIIDTSVELELDLYPSYLWSLSPTSDHKAFWGFDTIPSILMIEQRYFDNPNYHKCSDVWSYLHYDYMAEMVKAALGSAALLAGYRTGSNDTIPGDRIVLEQNWPNPFHGSTVITFSVPILTDVELAVYDVAGRRVALLIRDRLGPDRVNYLWDGTNNAGSEVASGVYFLRLTAGGMDATKKLVILR